MHEKVVRKIDRQEAAWYNGQKWSEVDCYRNVRFSSNAMIRSDDECREQRRTANILPKFNCSGHLRYFHIGPILIPKARYAINLTVAHESTGTKIMQRDTDDAAV